MSRITNFQLRCIIAVKATRQAAVNNYWGQNVDTDGAGDKTFTAGLSTTGQAPATWYWCGTSLTKPQVLAVKNGLNLIPASDYRIVIWPTPWGNVNDILEHFADNGNSIRVLNNESITPQQVLNAAGMQVVNTGE